MTYSYFTLCDLEYTLIRLFTDANKNRKFVTAPPGLTFVLWLKGAKVNSLPVSIYCKKRGVVLHPIRCSTASVASTLSLKLNFFCTVQG